MNGIRFVYNQLTQGTGENGSYLTHVVVDFYLLKTEEGIVKVEATQYLDYPETDRDASIRRILLRIK